MTDPRIAEARALRVDPGMSIAQLRKHFGVGSGLLTTWLRGIEPPSWTRRPNAKDDVRSRALTLRVAGWTVNDIATELAVSKSTVYGWVKHLPLDPDTERARAKERHAQKMLAARCRDGGRGRPAVPPRCADPRCSDLLVRGGQVEAVAP